MCWPNSKQEKVIDLNVQAVYINEWNFNFSVQSRDNFNKLVYQ